MTRQRAIEARAEQCSKFDNKSFNGYYFRWVPYLRGENKTFFAVHTRVCKINRNITDL